MTKKYIVEVTPITAVHIGTGNEFSPLDYVIKKNIEDKEVFLKFNAEKIISELKKEDKTKLIDYMEGDKIHEINNLFKEIVTKENSNYTSEVTPEIFDKYKNMSKNIGNQLLISEMYRTKSTFKPVIPGSSIKGALRTAIVSEIAKTKNTLRDKKNPEKEILEYDNAKNDPFRNLHITDCEINGDKTEKIADFINFKEKRKDKKDFSKMQMIKEHIIGMLLNGNAIGECDITFQEKIYAIKQEINGWQPFKKKIDIKEVVSSCNSFYFKNLEDEYNNFYKNSSHSILRENGKKLFELVEDIINKEKNECLIRVGQFSQIENVTIDKHREPLNPKGYGKTRTLTECSFPVGWVKLKFLSLEDAKELKKQKETERKQKELKIKEGFEKIEKEKREFAEIERLEKERIESLSLEDLLKEEIVKEIQSKDGQRISAMVEKCLSETKDVNLFVFLREEIKKIDEWKPKGMKVKQKRMKERNKKINEIIGE